MQVHPIKPTLKSPGTKLLKLKYEKLVSNFAFNFNFCRYTQVLRSLVFAMRCKPESQHILLKNICTMAGAYTRSLFSST